MSLLSASTPFILNQCKYLQFSICLASQKCFRAFKNVVAIPAHLVGNPVILGRLPDFHIYMYTELRPNMYFSTFCCPSIPNEMELLGKKLLKVKESRRHSRVSAESTSCFLLEHIWMYICFRRVCTYKQRYVFYMHTYFLKYIIGGNGIM